MRTRTHSVIRFIAAATVACACLSASAQDAPAPPPPPQMPTVTVTFDFPGGTLRDYVQTIRDAAGDDPVNVLLSDSAAQIPIPATSMRRVSPEAAFDVLSVVAEIPPSARLIVESSGGGRASAPAYAINLIDTGHSPFSRADREIKVFSLGWLLETPGNDEEDLPTLSTDEVLGAIESTVEMIANDDQPPADVRFHPDSNLLVVYGNPLQLHAVSDILESLGDDLRERRQEIQSTSKQMRDLEQQMEEMRIDMEQAARKNERREMHMNQLADLVEQGAISEDEDEFVDAITQLEASRNEMQRLESRMAFTEKRLRRLAGKPEEDMVQILYNVEDLGQFADQFGSCMQECFDLADVDYDAWEAPEGGVVIETTEPGHAMLQCMFWTMMQIMEDDPDLPEPEFEVIEEDGE